MSTTKKVLTIIFSILIIGAFAFVLTWGIINWSKVKEGMAGNGLYTQDDVQNAYEDGYNTALTDKEEYDKLINSYRDTITTQNDLISQYTSEATALNNSIKDHQAHINTLNEQKAALEKQIDTLCTIKASNEETISELNEQIGSMSYQVLVLQAKKDENAQQITQLNEQITNLQTLNEQLQQNNELNTTTINGLNAQIASLNNQIADLMLQAQNNASTVNALNAKIAELQKSVSYYEQYLGTLENGEQVVATFEFDGSVYNIQVVNKNSTLSVTEPTSTAYVIFNGWTVNGQAIDLSTYRITTNTKIVADVTYKYEVNFISEGVNYNNQIVLKDAKVTAPANPTKNGYVFDGWTLDGNNVVNLANYTITQNTTFTAKFTRLYSVVFKYEDTTLKTETVRSGNYATAPSTSSTAFKIFNGWKVNGIAVTVNEYRITADTVFVADITYKYEVRFTVDGNVHNTQMVEKHGKPTVPSNPTKANYTFVGWSLDGKNTVNVSKYMIVDNTTFIGVFELSTFDIVFMDGNNVVSSYQVDKGQAISNIPTVYNGAFAGWSLDGITILDLSSYTVNNHLTFIAVYAGLYEMGTDEMVMSWSALLDDWYFEFTNGCLMNYPNTKSLSGDLILPTTVKSFGSGLFTDCVNLTGVTITSETINIPADTFKGCKNLCSVDIIGTIGSIGDNAFAGCTSLMSITLKGSQSINIGANAFSGCTSLQTVWFELDTNLGDPSINIQSNTFSNVPAYLQIYIPYDVFSVHYDANWDRYSSMIEWY